MALWRLELGRCKRCRKSGQYYHTNHKQTQAYCKICEPIVEQEEIDNALTVLIRKGVTAEMFQRFLDKEPKRGGEGE